MLNAIAMQDHENLVFLAWFLCAFSILGGDKAHSPQRAQRPQSDELIRFDRPAKHR
jgi:hypothetical protein